MIRYTLRRVRRADDTVTYLILDVIQQVFRPFETHSRRAAIRTVNALNEARAIRYHELTR